MPKVNVYLPDAMATAVKEADISVSSVCQRALEQELARVRVRDAIGDDKLAAAAARLRGEFEELDQSLHDRGFADGRKWALERASGSDLLGLVEALSGVHYVRALANEDGWDVGPWSGETNIDDDNFAAGFVDGALEAWEQVSAQL